MTQKNQSEKTWNVLVTLPATISATLKVTANTQDEAGDKAVQADFVKANAPLFTLDADNFSNWASEAELPDPDNGIQLCEPDDAVTTQSDGYSDYQKKLLAVCSEAYEPSIEDRPNLSLPMTCGDNSSDGLAAFLSREFQDALKGESDESSRESLVRAINIARRQMEDIENALEAF